MLAGVGLLLVKIFIFGTTFCEEGISVHLGAGTDMVQA